MKTVHLEDNSIDSIFDDKKNYYLELYKNIKSVWCPYLECDVVFNAKGKEHLLFNGKYKARSHTEQYMRLKLIPYVSEVLKNSKTLQGYCEQRIFELNRSNQRNERVLIDVVFYEFIAILDKKIRIRVIIKQIENTPPYFWSVIPFWRKNKKTHNNRLHYGNPEED